MVPESSLVTPTDMSSHNAEPYLPRNDSHVEVLECDPVICIGPLQKGLEHDKIIPRHKPPLVRVRHAEEDGKLRTPELGEVASRRDGVHKLLLAEKPRNITSRT